MKLAAEVASILKKRGIHHALIGAFALGLHGFSRSSLDIDLLVLDRSVLLDTFWRDLISNASREVRRGDDEDPLAGVVRLRVPATREQVDVIVGRGGPQLRFLARAHAGKPPEIPAPYLRLADLVSLKLEAGGVRDKSDIQTILLSDRRAEVVAEVDSELRQLSPFARGLWKKLLAE